MLGSALENKFHAELGHAAAGVKRDDANEIVAGMVQRYKDKVTSDGGPWGYSFGEIYNTRTLEPRQEFQELYDKMSYEMKELGFDFES